MKRLLQLFILVIVIFSVWFWNATRPVDDTNTTTKTVTIDAGMSVSSIANRLSEQGILRSPTAFRLIAWYSDASLLLRSGTYAFSSSNTPSVMIAILKSGVQDAITVTIREGLNIIEIDTLFAQKGIFGKGAFQHCAFTCNFSEFAFLPSRRPDISEKIGSDMEGYLFPETYTFNRLTITPEVVMKRMLEEFQKRVINGKLRDTFQRQGISISDAIIMASLIEKESRHTEERAMVSGILWKRLNNHVVLGVDASNRYEVQKPTASLTKSDLEQRTPYNLRRVQGLPPTPITNPGLESIEAALSPTASRYWYYLHDNSGVIRYAETDAEHIANKRKYLQ